jgi:hypothetical protein
MLGCVNVESIANMLFLMDLPTMNVFKTEDIEHSIKKNLNKPK